jgi:hypothetical protein
MLLTYYVSNIQIFRLDSQKISCFCYIDQSVKVVYENNHSLFL